MRKPTPLPSFEYLHECFSYNPETGAFVWKTRPLSHFKGERGFRIFQKCYAGAPAFPHVSEGYYRGGLDGKLLRAHRVIWKMMTGDEPETIDHINGNGLDNRFINLRAANLTENAQNAKLRRDSFSGLKGVSYCNTQNKWMAQIRVNTRTKFLGHFLDKHEAHEAYRQAAIEHFGEFANFGAKSVEGLL